MSAADKRGERIRRERERKKLKRPEPRTESLLPKSDKDQTQPIQKRSQQPQTRWRQFLQLKWLLAAMTIVSFSFTLYSCRPRIHVAPVMPLSKKDIFSTQFTIANESLLDLKEVRASCTAIKVETDRYTEVEYLDLGSLDIGLIPSGESATAPCPIWQVFDQKGMGKNNIGRCRPIASVWLPAMETSNVPSSIFN